MGPRNFRLVRRRRGRPDQIWSCDVINNVVLVKTQEVGCDWLEEPREVHTSYRDARRRAEQLTQLQLQNGFHRESHQERSRQSRDRDRDLRFRSKRVDLDRDVEMERYPDSDNDTESITSSSMSLSENVRSLNHKYNFNGVSPLNRRRSQRILAMRKESTMQTSLVLESQNTVTMTSQNTVTMTTPPVALERMRTSGRWARYRGLPKQDTVGPSPTQTTSRPRVTLTSPDPSPWRQPRVILTRDDTVAVTSLKRTRSGLSRVDSQENSINLLSRKSTTRDLRLLMNTARLSTRRKCHVSITSSSEEVTSEHVTSSEEVVTSSRNNMTSSDEGLTSSPANKESQVDEKLENNVDELDGDVCTNSDLAPIPEHAKKRKSILNKKGKSSLAKKVTMVTPSEQLARMSVRPNRLKRKASCEASTRASKRLKTQHTVTKQQSEPVAKLARLDTAKTKGERASNLIKQPSRNTRKPTPRRGVLKVK